MMSINQILNTRHTIKGVWLNRESNNTGTKIGEIIRLRLCPFGKTFYYTKRYPRHYYIKGNGFCVDRGILKSLITKELDFHRNLTGDQNLKIQVLVDYEGKTVRRLLIANVEDFLESEDLEYVKGDEATMTTYGVQRELSENNFKLWKEERRDS